MKPVILFISGIVISVVLGSGFLDEAFAEKIATHGWCAEECM